MAFRISTTRFFAAAHALRLYDHAMEETHGHNWRVQVVVESPELDQIGVVMDFHDLERVLDGIISPWHNRDLNKCSPFVEGMNPTAENVAVAVCRGLVLPKNVKVVSVQVWETDTNSATYVLQQ